MSFVARIILRLVQKKPFLKTSQLANAERPCSCQPRTAFLQALIREWARLGMPGDEKGKGESYDKAR